MIVRSRILRSGLVIGICYLGITRPHASLSYVFVPCIVSSSSSIYAYLGGYAFYVSLEVMFCDKYYLVTKFFNAEARFGDMWEPAT